LVELTILSSDFATKVSLSYNGSNIGVGRQMMINPKKIEEVAKQLSENLPSGVKQFAAEFEERSKQVLQSQLMKLDVVSREEFEVQQHVLLKTREKLEALQAQVNELEKRLAD
jgi:BMFP domain-containing protein YqiC